MLFFADWLMNLHGILNVADWLMNLHGILSLAGWLLNLPQDWLINLSPDASRARLVDEFLPDAPSD